MRISREQAFLEAAQIFSRRSTCFRLNVGCIITIDNRIVSIGYNGPPSGEPHCMGNDCPLSKSGGCTRSIHAEKNALSWYKPNDRPMTLYTTHSPCPDCVNEILLRNVEAVYFQAEYRDTSKLQLLIDAGVKVYRVSPSGYKVDLGNGEVSAL